MLHFVKLIVNLFAFIHLVSFARSLFIFDFNEDSFGPSTTKQVSSAKSLGVQLRADDKSLIYSKNSKGPRVDPWGTP